jgi:hypothetical protein
MIDEPPGADALRRALDQASAGVPRPHPGGAMEAMGHGRRLQRRARILRFAAPGLGIVAVALVVFLIASSVGLLHRGKTAGASGGCPASASTKFGDLGAVAYIRDGALHVVDVRSLHDQVLIPSGAGLPVRWSPDGRWIAFERDSATLALVPAAGGPICEPLGSVAITAWSWYPTKPLLIGITSGGGVIGGGPEMASKRLQPEGWGATGSPVVDPTGHLAAMAREASQPDSPDGGLWVIEAANGDTREVYRVPSGRVGRPVVAGWGTDEEWVLFWPDAQASSSLAADGMPLVAVPTQGGDPIQVAPTMLLHRDFIAPCNGMFVIATGGGREAALGKHLFTATQPDWVTSPLASSPDQTQSAIWPACTKNGELVAASVGPSSENAGNQLGLRWTIEIFRTAGQQSAQAPDPGAQFSDEAPRWSNDGRYILFVRRAIGSERGALYLLGFGPGLEASNQATGPIADLGSYPTYYGYFPWSDGFDWYQTTARPGVP